MPTQDNLDTVRSLFAAIDTRDLDKVMDYVDDNVEWVNEATGEVFHGKAGIRRLLEGWWYAFPDSKLQIYNLFGDEDWVCVEYVGRGTFTGNLDWGSVRAQATGRSYEVKYCDVYRMYNGRVLSAHTYTDTNNLLRQIGVRPGPRGAT